MHSSNNLDVLAVVGKGLKRVQLGVGEVLRIHLQGLEHELAVLVVVAEAHEEPDTVGRNVRVVGGALGLHAVLRVVATLLLGDKGGSHAPGAHVIQGAGYLVTLAGAKCASVRTQDASGKSAAGVPVAEGDRRVAGLVMGVSLRNSAYEAGTCCECGSVEALGVLHGAELAIAAVLCPNKAGELLVKGLVVKTEALQCAGTEGGQEDICRLEQMVHDL